MADLFTINMNYRKGMEQACRLGELAQKLRTESTRYMEETMTAVSQNWQGENAAAYLAKCRLQQEKMIKTADKLQKAANTTSRIVKNTYDAEMRAFHIAQERTYQ